MAEKISFYMDCTFYGDNNELISSSELSLLGAGKNATVWKYRDKALKVFADSTSPFSLPYDTYKRLKELPLRKIVKANNIYRIDEPVEEKIDAYSMDYIEESPLLLSEVDTPTLLTNIEDLENDVAVLSYDGILMNDVKYDNSMINSSDRQLYITDIDMFYHKEEGSFIELLEKNHDALLWLITKHFLNDVKDLDLSEKEKERAKIFIYTYFSPKNITMTRIAEKTAKLFEKTETPKEYFLTRVR